MKILKRTVSVFFAFLISIQYSMAQCAMCRVTIENNVSHGETTVGAGLNMGILYLFSVPYLLLAVLAFFWYRHAKQRKSLSASDRSS